MSPAPDNFPWMEEKGDLYDRMSVLTMKWLFRFSEI